MSKLSKNKFNISALTLTQNDFLLDSDCLDQVYGHHHECRGK